MSNFINKLNLIPNAMKRLFYVDTCIYLNLWQKESDAKQGIPFWQLAKDFFDKYDNDETTFYYSGFVLKELKYILSEEEFNKKQMLFRFSPNFKKLILSTDELEQARKIEAALDYEISFYDIIHMLLAKKANAILVTRDNKLLDAARKYNVAASRPEELL